MKLFLAGLVTVGLLACGGPDGEGDSGMAPPVDAGQDAHDAGQADPDSGGIVDAGPVVMTDAGPDVDGGPLRGCADGPPLELGRCRDSLTSFDCMGMDTEVGDFTAMLEDEELRMVIGPQGSTMFVLSARSSGFDPGDPDVSPVSTVNPTIELTLLDEAGEVVTLYRGRGVFTADPAVPGAFFRSELFIVVDESASLLVGQRLTADGILRDRTGVERCGSLTFIAAR